MLKCDNNKFTLLLVTSLEKMEELKTDWDSLHGRVCGASPFLGYQWIRNWYRCYTDANAIRVLAVFSEEGIRAILPGFIGHLGLRGFGWSVFRCAADGQTPHGGILAADDDLEAVIAALRGISSMCHGVAVAHLTNLSTDDVTFRSLNKIGPGHAYFTESVFLSYQYVIDKNWEIFAAQRSKNFRHRLNSSQNRSNRFGEMSSDVYSGKGVLAQLHRLQCLDSLTWQGKQQRGVFRRKQDLTFWQDFLSSEDGNQFFLIFLRFGEVDAAFMTLIIADETMYQLRFGYNDQFQYCRPGVLIRTVVSQYFISRGVRVFDMGATGSFEKEQWENRREDYRNIYFVQRLSLKGLLFCFGLSLWRLKRIVKWPWGRCLRGGAR